MITIEEKLKKIYNRDNWQCQKCGEPATEIAHRIAKGKVNRHYIYNFIFREYGDFLKEKQISEIIHHPLNTVASCRDCNSYFNIGNIDLPRDLLIRTIYDKIREEK